MKLYIKTKQFILLTAILSCILLPTISFAVTDNYYTLTEVTPDSIWNGTSANRYQDQINGYAAAYGDESILSYSLPWPIPIYGRSYSAITADTNGNIWFIASAVPVHNMPLSTNPLQAPVIAAWNDDHSSAFYGGVFIQHKTDAPLGDRVIVEWQTETYTDEGFYVLNSFKTVLFPDGRIRIDYQPVNSTTGTDSFGSGVSRSNGTYLDITSNFAQIPTLCATVPRSFLYTPTTKNIQITYAGAGGGTVTSNPSGVACNTTCTTAFLSGEQVTLLPAPDQYSLFNSWAGTACTVTGTQCQVTLDSDASVTATFDPAASQLSGTFYPSVQDAYNHAVSGNIIYSWDYAFSDGLICDQARDVTILGGYDKIYSTVTGTTRLLSPMIIRAGSVKVKNLAIASGGASPAAPMMTTATFTTAAIPAVPPVTGPALIRTSGTKKKCEDDDRRDRRRGEHDECHERDDD